MKPKKKIIIPLLLAAVLVASAYSYSRWFRKTDLKAIKVSGNIELTEVNVAFKIPGKLIERTVDEGDAVTSGMIIARLDQEQLLHQRDRARAMLAAAESRMAQLQTAIQLSGENSSGQIEQRRAELAASEASLRDLLAGSRSQEIEQARAGVERARAEYTKAESDWTRAQSLYKADDISTADRDAARTRYETAKAALRQAEEYYKLVAEGPRKDMIEASRAQVARSQAGLKLAHSSRLDTKRLQQQIDSSRAEIDQIRAEIASIESQLNDTVAASPVGGTVLVKSAEPGEVIAAGTTILSVGDMDHPWLRGYISERDLGRVKIGTPVQVTTDSFPGKTYRGRVSFISSEAEFTPKQIQTQEERVKLVYRIKIEVENPDRELKSNMPADATIQID